jgi:hypothetical protein
MLVFLEGEGYPVHGDPVKGREITIGADWFSKDTPMRLAQQSLLHRGRERTCKNDSFGLCGGNCGFAGGSGCLHPKSPVGCARFRTVDQLV